MTKLKNLFLAFSLMSSFSLYAGTYIEDFSSEEAISLDTDEGRQQLKSQLQRQKHLGRSQAILVEYSAQYDVSNLQIHLPVVGQIGRVLRHIPLVGGLFNRFFQEFSPPKALTLRALLYPALQPKGYLLGVHGLQSNASWYHNSAHALAQKGVTSLFFDRRGSGMSDSVTDGRGRPMRGHVSSSSLDHLLGGPLNLAIGDASEFLEDIHVSYEHLYLVRELQGVRAPIHLYANCFGSRIALAYAQEWNNPREGIASIIMTSPGTNMKKGEVHGLVNRLGVLGPIEAYRDIDLVDEDFTSNPVALEEMADENLSLILRQVTNRFLLSASGVTKKMKDVFKSQRLANVPALVIIPENDKIIHTAETQATFAEHYPGPTLVSWMNTEHMIEFDHQARESFVELVSQWIYNQEQGWAGNLGPRNFAGHIKAQAEAGLLPKLDPNKLSSYRD